MSAEFLSQWEAPVAAWILTFAVHSTLLLGLAWCIAARWRSLPDAVREAIWKSACLGAVLTASFQLALVGEPLAGHVAQLGGHGHALGPSIDPLAALSGVGVLPAALRPADSLAGPLHSARGAMPLTWHSWVLLVALLSAGFGSLRGFLAGRSTRRLLRQREPLRDGLVPARLGRLCARLGYWRSLRVSQHPDLQTPIAFGALRPEICLPRRAFADLDEAQQSSMLVHELGHLLRRDPLWLMVNGLLIALFPWQPLLRLARRRIQGLAEFRSDALAAEFTGNLDTASCLLEVASWVASGEQSTQWAVIGMALGNSRLKMRMDRLLSGDLPKGIGRHRLWLLPLSTVLLTVATTVLPGAEFRSGGRNEGLLPRMHSDSHHSTVGLLAELIRQMDLEFSDLSSGVDGLREELADGPQDTELTSMLVEIESRLASLERHRELFEEVLTEWSAEEAPEPGPNPSKQTK